VDDYVWTLSDELKEIAEKELRETAETRSHSIKAMRDWIMSNPRIEKCRMDSKFILRFLRFRKFSVPAAQEALERYLVFREGAYGHDWFSNMDFDKPNINGLLEKGLYTVLPNRDKLGQKVILAKLAAADPSIPTIGNECLTLGTMIFETLLEDEENQIRGLNYILDVSNIKLRHYFIFSFLTWYKFLKNVEVSRNEVNENTGEMQKLLLEISSENLCHASQRFPRRQCSSNFEICRKVSHEAHAGKAQASRSFLLEFR
jgi:hypothetical protein